MCVFDTPLHVQEQVVANTLGLNDSKYQYVIDALEADEYRREREERDEEHRRRVRKTMLNGLVRSSGMMLCTTWKLKYSAK